MESFESAAKYKACPGSWNAVTDKTIIKCFLNFSSLEICVLMKNLFLINLKNPLWDNVARDYVYSDSHVPVCELRIIKEVSHENMQNLTESDSDTEIQKNSKVTSV